MQHCWPGSNIFANRAETSVTSGGVHRMTEEVLRQNRRYSRISLPKGMRVVWHGGDLQLFSRVRTLGMGGLFISVPDPPPVGTKLRLSFEVPGGNVHAEAIARRRDGCRVHEVRVKRPSFARKVAEAIVTVTQKFSALCSFNSHCGTMLVSANCS